MFQFYEVLCSLVVRYYFLGKISGQFLFLWFFLRFFDFIDFLVVMWFALVLGVQMRRVGWGLLVFQNGEGRGCGYIWLVVCGFVLTIRGRILWEVVMYVLFLCQVCLGRFSFFISIYLDCRCLGILVFFFGLGFFFRCCVLCFRYWLEVVFFCWFLDSNLILEGSVQVGGRQYLRINELERCLLVFLVKKFK